MFSTSLHPCRSHEEWRDADYKVAYAPSLLTPLLPQAQGKQKSARTTAPLFSMDCNFFMDCNFSFLLSLPSNSRCYLTREAKTQGNDSVSPGIPNHISMLLSERKADYQKLSAEKHTTYSWHWCSLCTKPHGSPFWNVWPKFHVHLVNPLQFAAFSNYISKQLEGLN